MKGFFLLFTICCLTACLDKTKSDVDIIPKDKMTKVIWDIIQVDEYVSSNLVADSTKNIKNERLKLYNQVFQLHKISKNQFTSSFKFYSARPDMLKVLFDTLGARAERERGNVYLSRDSQP